MAKKRWLFTALFLLLAAGTVALLLRFTNASGTDEHKGAQFVWNQTT